MRPEPNKYLQLTLFVLCMLWSIMAMGGDETYLNSLKGTHINPGKSFTAQDGWHTYMSLNPNDWENRSQSTALMTPYNRNVRFTNLSIDGFVSLRWEGSEKVAFNADWFYKIEVELLSWDAAGNPLPATIRTLAINHKVARQQEFKDWDVFQLPNADKIITNVRSIERSTDGVNFSTVTQITEEDIYLETKIVVERAFTIDVSTTLTLQQNPPISTNRTITHVWSPIQGAEEYDFEWLFISGERGINPSTGATYTYGELIDWDNASRVSLNHNEYTLELPYEAGRVYFRVRAVGYGNELKARLITNWSTNVVFLNIGVGQTIEPLEQTKNWTYSVNYAEQGKRVESLTIADGTGRGRQSVTKDNSNNRAIVAETVFDREGRQSIQVIPSVAPSTQNQLNFHENYNLTNSSNKPIHWTDFDDANAPTSLILSRNSGANQYFSDQNPDLGTSIVDFIPNAEDKPYTQTVFDNQGRVTKQSGVGEIHSIGSGHETRYFYAAAFQEDLDELFGSEIGYAEHYAMQMTADPNGQRSISYTNLSGKTVATALVGVAPRENDAPLVEELEASGYNYATAGRVKTRDLAPHNELEREENRATWVVQKEFMVASEGDYEFTYYPFIGNYNQCFSDQDGTCEFELRISIYDKQGKNVTSSNISNIALVTTSTPVPTYLGDFFTVVDGDRLTFTFNANTADIGAYTIVKELRLKDVTHKVDDFYTNLLDYKILYEAYITQYYEDFQYNLLSPSTPRTLPIAPVHPYSDCVDFEVRAAGDWLNPCFLQIDTNASSIVQNYCTTTRNNLKYDLLPNGQYFENAPDATNPNGWLDANNDISGGLVYNGTSYTNWSAVKGLSAVEVEDFMEAHNLFEAHPEWCLYEDRCLDDGPTINQNSWYEDLLQQNAEWMTMSVSDAQAAGYLNFPSSFCSTIGTPNGPANSSYPLIADVLGLLPSSFGTGSAYETALLDALCNYAIDNSGASPVHLDAATLSNYSGTATNQEIWERIRAMMIDAKERALDAHTATLSNCDYLVDADLTDNQLIDGDGFDIRIASYSSHKDQLHQNTGVSTNIGATGTAIDSDTLNTYINTIGQQYGGACDYHEGIFTYDCNTASSGQIIQFTLDYNNSAYLQSIYGAGANGTNIIDVFKIDYNAINCTANNFATLLQLHLENQIANLAAPLNTDLQITVVDDPAGGVQIITHFPGTTYNSTGITNGYDGVLFYQLTSGGGNISQTDITMNYMACDQAYTICICEDIKSLETYFLATNIAPVDLYTTIANKYNYDLNLTGGNLIDETTIKYILAGYCEGTVPTPTFTPFVVAPASTAANHLPLEYPTIGFDAYETWKATFRADPNIPIAFQEEMKECLDLSSGLSCEEEALALAIFHASEIMDQAAEEAKQTFKEMLLTQCMAKPIEEFTMTYTDNTMHHTLYYYDASGNLEKTVPPTGVTLLATAQEFQDAATERNTHTGNLIEPSHRLVTTYAYNTLNNVIHSTAPDRGTVTTYYDKLGRAVLTQNAQQAVDGSASYVIYDALGRITETGVTEEAATNLSFNSYKASPNFQADINAGTFPSNVVNNYNWTKKEVRTTYYNIALLDNLFELPNNLLRNRVGTQTYAMDGQNTDYQVAYNYDVFGNAQEVWQYYPHLLGNPYKQLKYDYDLIAGVVHQVDYQEGERDQLSFQYTYDANNRLTKAKSSTNGFIWSTDARYDYYLHGPLKRVEIGEDKVQGMDYVYTMHGWIKGVNSNQLQSNLDPGKDGENGSSTVTNIHDQVAKDVFGYAVHYYEGDYSAINSTVQNFSTNPTGTGNLYNGNISSVTQAQTKPALGGGIQEALPSIWKRYRYDLLHRIVKAQTAETVVGSSWASPNWAGTTAYQTSYKYGPNGNITNLTRYGQTTTAPIDELTYNYTGTTTVTTDPKQFANNQLLGIQDAAGSSPNHTDITTQPSTGSGNTQQNYLYDHNGSLLVDQSEEIGNIAWTAEKKIAAVQRTSGSIRDDLRYIYDFQGNRISKIVVPNSATEKERHQVYVRDPQGNTLAIYEYQKAQTGTTTGRFAPPVFLKEQLLYGSDRLGTIKRNTQTGGYVRILGDGRSLTGGSTTLSMMVNSYLEYTTSAPEKSYLPYTADINVGVDTNTIVPINTLSYLSQEEFSLRNTGGIINNSTIFAITEPVIRRLEQTRGHYRYELKNFRGDIRQVITDVKHRDDNNGVVEYTADVVQVTDSYSFGWEISDRSFSSDMYRFGFNGKENDADFGNQLIQDYGFRLYNPAIAKFLSVDPLSPEYPELTPYQFASNSPVDGVDLDGLEHTYAADGSYIGVNESDPQLKHLVTVEIDGESKFLTSGRGDRMTHDEFVKRNFYTFGEGGGWLPNLYAQTLKNRMDAYGLKSKKKAETYSKSAGDKMTKFENSEGKNGNYELFQNFIDNDFDLSKMDNSNEDGNLRNRIQANTKANLIENIEGGSRETYPLFRGQKLSNWRGASRSNLNKWLTRARNEHNIKEFGGIVYVINVIKNGKRLGNRYHIFFRQEYSDTNKRHPQGLPQVNIATFDFKNSTTSSEVIEAGESHNDYINRETKK
ncbi:MAG: RHS repeat-associated core domain-containing protein [Aureispira sp.]